MIGKTVGHYRVLAKLGAGGMGEVFLAEDTRLERRAAIKILPEEWAADLQRRQRFLKEARAASALNHPHVCVVYDVGETDDGVPFIAMEFVEGQSLEAVVKQGPLEVTNVIAIAAQVADALDAAHASRIVHRDIKPANITLNERGGVKVLDFGLAKRVPLGPDQDDRTQDAYHTQDGVVLGTPAYMSPEQALGKEVDHRTDIFSLGVVLYELTTGLRPFRGVNFAELVNHIVQHQPPAISRLNYNVPPELERITLKCLQKLPDRRYQAARELMIDLQNLMRQLEHGILFDEAQNGDRLQATLSYSDRPVVATDPPALEHWHNSDVLLNYASIDDHPLQQGQLGWVSQLHRNLEVRMEQLSGEKVRIARLAGFPTSSPGTLESLMPQAKAMISVVSPPFVVSEWCQRGVEEFWRGAEQSGGRWVDEKSRLMKVLKTAVPTQQMPARLAEIFSPLAGFEFFELDAATGRVREFDETFGPALKQRFFERVYDLAFDTCQVISGLKRERGKEGADFPADPNRKWIYLATTTSDVQDERDRIKRELVERGHVVLPDGPLPMLLVDVEKAVCSCLEKCTVAIHLLGRHYGVTPEDAAESLPALQLRMTARYSAMQRLVWMQDSGAIADERQRTFVQRVQEDPAMHAGAEIIEGNLNLLKKDLIRRLMPPEGKPTSAPPKSAGSAAKLYLICDPKDEAEVEPLEDYLFEQGLEVCLPAFDGNGSEALALHQDNLLQCDGAIVFYGAAPKAWVDIKLRELLKAPGYGREGPIAVQAVYIAPPDDHRKERYRSHQARVIRSSDSFQTSSDLGALIADIKEAGR